MKTEFTVIDVLMSLFFDDVKMTRWLMHGMKMRTPRCLAMILSLVATRMNHSTHLFTHSRIAVTRLSSQHGIHHNTARSTMTVEGNLSLSNEVFRTYVLCVAALSLKMAFTSWYIAYQGFASGGFGVQNPEGSCSSDVRRDVSYSSAR